MKKKLLALLLVSVMVTSFLAGCSSKSENNTDNNTTDNEVKPTQVVEEEVVADPFGKYEDGLSLRGTWLDTGGTIFVPGNPDYDSPEKNVFITAYKEKLGIDVIYDWVSSDTDAYNTKWNMAMAQNNLPDFGMVYAEQYKMLLDAGLVMDMTDLFEKYASDKYKEFLAADGGATLGYSTQNGRMMGLPITGAQPDSVALFYIRQDWLDKVGMQIPKTMDELQTVAQAFVDNKLGGEDTYGLVGSKESFGLDLGFLGFLNGYGAYPDSWLVDDNGKLFYGTTMEQTKAGLLKLQDMYAKGLINKDFAVTDKTIAKEDVASGKVGIAYGTYYLASGIADNAIKDSEANWVITEIPTVDGNKPVVQGSVSRSQFIFVNKDCKNPEAIIKLLNLEIDLIFNEDPEVVKKYTTHLGPDGEKNVQTSKYVASVQFCGMPWQNLTRYQESVKALETGAEEFTLALSQTTYQNHLKYQDGDITQWNSYHIFGPLGTFSVIDKIKQDNRILVDAYQAIPTETMTAKKSILVDSLNTAMTKVIMGEDISLYEDAVNDWNENGGQIMAEEVNTWYQNNK
ncbi:MAG: extracellular solute-binding protein [Herbinix sp.]|jgi:putative aldouronate transport system substrate-binding protein|nr:extracellular solute-binding protein [Herbinix sp.]MDF2907722.1 extracellular solute-binding protein [Herbinix sp.]